MIDGKNGFGQQVKNDLTLIWVGFLEVHFKMGWDWPEIQKSEISPSEVLPTTADGDKLGTPNLAKTPLLKCYWMLQNFWVTPVTVSALLMQNQQAGKITPSPQIGVKNKW